MAYKPDSPSGVRGAFRPDPKPAGKKGAPGTKKPKGGGR